MGRFEDLVTGLIVASDPEEAALQEERVARRQVARPTRSTKDGMRSFFIRGPFPVIAADKDVRRVKAVASSPTRTRPSR